MKYLFANLACASMLSLRVSALVGVTIAINSMKAAMLLT
jgi:hypothetical protein